MTQHSRWTCFASFVALAGVALAFATPTHAQDAQNDEPPPTEASAPTLAIGDPAPALDVGTWHEGEATGIDEGKVYVVEFWATWCGPCKKSMPHLAHLQAELADKDVHIIGVSSEDAETVTEWLQKRGEPVGYRIATDPDMSTEDAWMTAAKQEGIPTAFVVGRTGKVEWIGHPTSMGPVLTAVADDRFDGEAYAAWNAKHDEKAREYQALYKAEKWRKAARVLEELAAEHDDAPDLYGSALAHRRQLYLLYAAKLDKPKKASVVAQQIIDEAWADDGMSLNNLAWDMTTAEGIERRDLELALKASVRSNLLQVGNPAFLDTLARIYFEMGDLKSALRYQRDAVAHMEHADPEVRGALERYEAAAEKAGLEVPSEPTGGDLIPVREPAHPGHDHEHAVPAAPASDDLTDA